jgi:hypothetical protein
VAVGHPARRKVLRQPGDPEDTAGRIQFEPGKSSATINGQTSSSDEYLIRARAGQTINVKVTSADNYVTVWVESDVGEQMDSSWETEWIARLPITGEYRIIVSGGPKPHLYTLEVTIR